MCENSIAQQRVDSPNRKKLDRADKLLVLKIIFDCVWCNALILVENMPHQVAKQFNSCSRALLGESYFIGSDGSVLTYFQALWLTGQYERAINLLLRLFMYFVIIVKCSFLSLKLDVIFFGFEKILVTGCSLPVTFEFSFSNIYGLQIFLAMLSPKFYLHVTKLKCVLFCR